MESSDIIGEGKKDEGMIYGGIDIHKRYSVVSLINERGECLETQRVMNEKDGF
ncbi:MAG: hypothetical protein QME48_08715 [bacterium]|nr:hypothetical protein [bacterium]